jgi:hypothetical protein
MAYITFSAEFRGGTFGFVEFTLRRNGFVYTSFVIKNSGTNTVDLENGLYLISLNGVATPGGTRINISGDTNPPTPDDFEEGPIFKGYVLSL